MHFPHPLVTPLAPVVVPTGASVTASKAVRMSSAPSLKWDYKTYITYVNEGYVSSARIRQDQKSVHVITLENREYFLDLPEGYDEISFLMNAGVDVSVEKVSPLPPIVNMFEIVMQLIALRFVFSFMSGNMKQIGTKVEASDVDTKFGDVAGAHNAKRDLKEIVEFLKKPEEYEYIGATIPKGVLLTGPPGVGKTLLARSVAGEAKVPFFSCSGSEFMQMFVGMGANRVRELFKQAQKTAPAIIFIDEIDSIGKSRNNTINGEEREHTLNQLLACMDGFNASQGVIIIAATNRPDILDEALMRPGRFDRTVAVELPDMHDRLAILNVHCRNKQLAADVDLFHIARSTGKFSGASLAKLANEAALTAVRKKNHRIMMADWTTALDRMLLGEETDNQYGESKKIFAYHEAGHALMSILSSEFDDIHKVSIVRRGRIDGITLFEPNEEKSNLITKEYMKNQIMVGLAGRAAEELVFGLEKTTTGARHDFQKVTSIAYDMITNYGFGDIGTGAFGMSGLDDVGGVVSDEVKSTLAYCYAKSLEALKQYEPFLHRLASALMKSGTLSMGDVREIVTGISCDRK